MKDAHTQTLGRRNVPLFLPGKGHRKAVRAIAPLRPQIAPTSCSICLSVPRQRRAIAHDVLARQRAVGELRKCPTPRPPDSLPSEKSSPMPNWAHRARDAGVKVENVRLESGRRQCDGSLAMASSWALRITGTHDLRSEYVWARGTHGSPALGPRRCPHTGRRWFLLRGQRHQRAIRVAYTLHNSPPTCLPNLPTSVAKQVQ